MRILLICTGNTCRSQMAEGFLRSFDNSLIIHSAGTKAETLINPNAVKVMSEIGIDISGGLPESVSKYLMENFDYVITVCDNAREICPVFLGEVKFKLHFGFEDPANAVGTEEKILYVYRQIRDEIHTIFYNFYQKELKSQNSNV